MMTSMAPCWRASCSLLKSKPMMANTNNITTATARFSMINPAGDLEGRVRIAASYCGMIGSGWGSGCVSGVVCGVVAGTLALTPGRVVVTSAVKSLAGPKAW